MATELGCTGCGWGGGLLLLLAAWAAWAAAAAAGHSDSSFPRRTAADHTLDAWIHELWREGCGRGGGLLLAAAAAASVAADHTLPRSAASVQPTPPLAPSACPGMATF